MIDYSLYLVTDEGYQDLPLRLQKVLNEQPVTLVQYRAKHKTLEEQIKEATVLKRICDGRKIPLIVDDAVEVALVVGAAGVHLGQDDMPCREARALLGPDKIIGITVHNVDQALEAQGDGADYLGAGAVYPTTTKNDVEVMGLKLLGQICRSVTIPVVGIGGINFMNRDEVLRQGAKGVAMVTALLGELC